MKCNIARIFAMAAITSLALGLAPTAKADDKGCSNASLKGTFAFTSTGFTIAPPERAGPVGEVGTQTFDGNGTTTAAATLSGNGNLFQVTLTGTYTVNPDCTGTSTLLVSPFGVTIHVFFVVADGGNEFHGIETESGLVATRIGRRLFPGRAI